MALQRSVLCLIFLTFGLLAKTSSTSVGGQWCLDSIFPITLSSQMSSVIFIDVILCALHTSCTTPSREPLHTISLWRCSQNYRIVHAYPGLIAHHKLCLSLSSSSRHPGRWTRRDGKTWKVCDTPSLSCPDWYLCLRQGVCNNMGGCCL